MTHSLSRIALAAALTVAACASPAPEETVSDSVVPVTTVPAGRGDVTATIHATGLVTPAPGAELTVVAPEPARIAEMPKAEGDRVRRGDLLVRFEIPSAAAEVSKQRAEIGRAEARLASATAAQTRMTDLFARGVAARKEVEEATREVADAQADLAAAQAAATAATTVAARSVVRATFDGVVSRRTHNPGDLVDASASDPVLRVVDPRRLEVAAQIPFADVARIRVGAPAHVATPAATGEPAALTVASLPVAVAEGMVTVPVRLAFTTPPAYPIGTPLTVAIDAETHAQVVTVPAAAVVHEGEETAVFVAAGGVAHRHVVRLGLDGGDRVEVTSGIQPGDAVIVTNQNGLPDGAKVTTESAAKAAADDGAAGKGEP